MSSEGRGEQTITISITPVLSRSLEKYIVRTFIYPALQLPYPELCFDDQFAFWPTGSTVIALLHTVRTMLSTDQYVHVFSLRHSTPSGMRL